jgi:hypothetical protein
MSRHFFKCYQISSGGCHLDVNKNEFPSYKKDWGRNRKEINSDFQDGGYEHIGFSNVMEKLEKMEFSFAAQIYIR